MWWATPWNIQEEGQGGNGDEERPSRWFRQEFDYIFNDINTTSQNQPEVGVEVSDSDADVMDDPLPGGSRRRGQEEDNDEDEEDSKRFKWDWDDFAESEAESDTESDVESLNTDQWIIAQKQHLHTVNT